MTPPGRARRDDSRKGSEVGDAVRAKVEKDPSTAVGMTGGRKEKLETRRQKLESGGESRSLPAGPESSIGQLGSPMRIADTHIP
jgi:hypothetical protein